MQEFANTELLLNKSVEKGENKSLLALLSAAERFKPMEVLTSAEEDSPIRITLEGLGEIDLKLGTDVEKGQKKTIMTLLFHTEREKPFEIKRDAKAGESISVRMSLLS